MGIIKSYDQLINKPTWVYSNTTTLIDHSYMYINNSWNGFEVKVSDYAVVSDHFAVCSFRKLSWNNHTEINYIVWSSGTTGYGCSVYSHAISINFHCHIFNLTTMVL